MYGRATGRVTGVLVAGALVMAAAPADARCLILSQSNSRANTLFVYRVSPDGGVGLSQRLATGGSGNSGRLHSSSSIATAAGNTAFVVNAKSDTVTAFARHGYRMSRERTVPSGGTTPKSLWVQGDRLYVLNAGTPVLPEEGPIRRVAPAVVRAFTISGTTLTRVPRFRITLPDTCRSYPCDARANYAQVAVPPREDAVVVSDTDGSRMVVASLDARGRPGTARNFPSGTPHPYGFSVSDRGVFVVTGNRTSGTGVVGTGRVVNGRWRTITGEAVSGGGDSCWVTLSHDGGYAYVSSVGNGSLPAGVTSLRLTRRGEARVIGLAPLPMSAADRGPLDLSIDPRDRYVYATNRDGVWTFRVRDGVATLDRRRSVTVEVPGSGTIGSGQLPVPGAGRSHGRG